MIKFFIELDTPLDSQLLCVLNNQSVNLNIIFLLKLKQLMLLISFLKHSKRLIFKKKKNLKEINLILQALPKILKNNYLQIYLLLFWMWKKMTTKKNQKNQKKLMNWIYFNLQIKKTCKIWQNQNGKNIWKPLLKKILT